MELYVDYESWKWGKFPVSLRQEDYGGAVICYTADQKPERVYFTRGLPSLEGWSCCFLKKILRHVFVDNLDFTLASLTYIAAHVIDYLFTAPGIRGTGYSEGNPIIHWYIDRLGIEGGLLGYKLIVCAAIIAGMKAADLIMEKENSKSRIRLKVEYILYGGAILTTSGGALWLLF